MAETSENMILRTVYLPRELEQKLKAVAIRAGRTKGDIVREMIRSGLEALEKKEPKADPATPVVVKPVTARKVSTLAQRKTTRTKKGSALAKS